MSTPSPPFQPPACRTEHMEPLAPFESAAGEDQFWLDVHELTQRCLHLLDERVRSELPDIHLQSGKTHGRNFHLFSYVTYSRTGVAEIDPVVAGVTFARIPGKEEQLVEILADLSGEHTGDAVVPPRRRVVPRIRKEILETAEALAAELSRDAGRIAEALRDNTRSV